jgi:hypothetical protein
MPTRTIRRERYASAASGVAKAPASKVSRSGAGPRWDGGAGAGVQSTTRRQAQESKGGAEGGEAAVGHAVTRALGLRAAHTPAPAAATKATAKPSVRFSLAARTGSLRSMTCLTVSPYRPSCSRVP